MPLYEYYCLDCREVFDALRPMQQSDAPIRCRACEGVRTRRALSLVAARVASDSGASPGVPSGGCGCGGACACGGH